MTTNRTSLEQLDHTITKVLEKSIVVAASVVAIACLCVLGWQTWEHRDTWGSVTITLVVILGLAYGWIRLFDRFIAVRIGTKIFWTVVAVAGMGYLLAGLIGWMLSHV